MSFLAQEIETQPALWQRAAALAAEQADALPSRGQRVAFFGCGTSLFIAQAIAAAREMVGDGESDAFAASEMPRGRPYQLAVAVSRSGTTTEVVALARNLRDFTPVVAITADPGSPLNEVVSRSVVMPFADERSVVQTRFATCTLALFRAHLGETLAAAISEGERALRDPPPQVNLGSVRQWVFLGRGWSVGLANEAALKVREAAQAWTEAYPAMEYRHGPISVAGPGTVVWALDQLPQGLADQITSTGATVLSAAGDPMAELLRVQRLALTLAQSRGLDPDRPRHLTRSVVLDERA